MADINPINMARIPEPAAAAVEHGLRGYAADIEVDDRLTCRSYRGTREALMRHRIIEAAWLPGAPGQPKSVGHARKDGRTIRVYLRGRNKVEAFFYWTAEEYEHRKAMQRLEQARRTEAEAIARLPASAAGFQDQALERLALHFEALSRLTSLPEVDGGYAFATNTDAAFRAALAEALDVLRMGDVTYSAERQHAGIQAIRARTAKCDPGVVRLMTGMKEASGQVPVEG